MKKILLIDGSNLLHRAYHALPPLTNAGGQPTNAVYGLLMMLQKVMAREQPTHVAICFDRGKGTFRHREYPAYKAQRKPTDAELISQFPLAEEVLTLNGYRCLDSEEYEADDIIGALARRGQQDGEEVLILSGDKDLLQLLGDHIRVLSFKKGISELDVIDEAVFRDRYGLAPAQMIDLKALMGDSSDNIPGVRGVGEKTALKLLHQYNTLAGVYEAIGEMPNNKLKEHLLEDQEQAHRSYRLVTIADEMPLDLTWDDLVQRPKNYAALRDLYRNLEFRGFLKNLEAEESADTEADSLFDDEPAVTVSYTRLTAEDFWESARRAGSVALHHAGNDFFLATPDGTATLLRRHEERERAVLCDILQAEGIAKVGHCLKDVYHLAFDEDIQLAGVVDDVEIMAYLADSSFNSYRLAVLLDTYCNIDVSDSGEQSQLAAAVACFDLADELRGRLQRDGSWQLYEEVEKPLVEVLAAMEHAGIRVDRQVLQEMSGELDGRLTEIMDNIYQLAGTTFNLNSPKQMGEVLFEKLHLPKSKKTKTGYSTRNEVLEELYDSHPIIPVILQYRQLAKLKSTYTDALAKLIDPKSGHIHTQFRQTVTTTGRLSSTDPNLQNIPIRLAEGRKVRKAFLASDSDHVLLAADYSQIELRLLAHYAEDHALLDSFRHNEDIHERTAREIFNVGKGEVDRDLRRRAKAVNFGIIYGISGYGLSRDLGIDRSDAQQYIDRYFQRYPQVDAYLKRTVAEAKERGYVTTLLGRRRYLPDLKSRNYNVRSFAERTAMNTPLQGSAADIIKGAMVHLYRTLAEQGLRSKIILQVHDELIVDCCRDELPLVVPLMRRIMEETYTLRVPLVVDMKMGDDWYYMEKIER